VGSSPGQLVPIGVDLLLDGLLIGIAMTAGTTQGILLTIALTRELFSLGLAMAVQYYRGDREPLAFCLGDRRVAVHQTDRNNKLVAS
jgi:zinc transporter ZupT